MKDIIIIDLDGTLCNVDHRTHFVRRNKPDFKSFYNVAEHDTVNEWCKTLIQSFWDSAHEIYLVSARHRGLTYITKKWLSDNKIPYTRLCLLRDSEKESTPDIELKETWLRNQTLDFIKRILFAVDDRQRIVDMWRDNGLVCLQCASWKEFKRN